MPLSMIAIFMRRLRQDGDPRVGHVSVQIPRLLQFKRGGVVNLNFKAGAINIELLSVARHSEAEPAPAGDLGFLRQTIGGQIKPPELAPLISEGPVCDDRVSEFLIRCDLQTRHAAWRWADRIVRHLPRCQIQTSQTEDTVVDNWIGRVEDRRVHAGLADQIQVTSQVDILHAVEIRLSQVQLIDYLEVRGLENGDLRPELI